MTAPLRRVLLRSPRAPELRHWREYGWRAEPNAVGIAREHEALCELLESAGAEVVLSAADVDGDPDAIYVYDPVLIVNDRAVLLRPGKAGRRGEPAALGVDLEQAGLPVAAPLDEPAFAEGGDLLRLDERTLLVGLGYRTNQAGAGALAEVTGLNVFSFDLPHWHGESKVMHLLSLLSPLADDLVVAYKPLLPVRLAQLLAERAIEIVEGGNPNTRRRLEQAGVEVFAYEGKELSKGDGGPTCLTCPLLRR